MIPSGYKNQKVYCAVPTDGSADLTFTRASNATRVASNGLIEKVRENVLLQSVWPNIGSGVAPTSWLVGVGPATNFSAGPLAGQLLCNTSANRGFITQSVSLTAGQYALSVFVDSVVTTNTVADLILIFGSTDRKYYEDGVEVNLNTNIVAGKRYAMVGTVTTGSFSMRVGSGINANATANYVISRPQLEVSDFGATDYIATTTTAVSVGPVSGLPRLDYLNSSCPRLLLEPQRTNDILNNTVLNNYTATRATWGVNVAISPTGDQDAEKLIEDTTASNTHFFGIGASYVSATAYTWSIYLKADGRDAVRIQAGNLGVFPINCDFNLSTQTTTNNGSGTAAIIDAGNGWYRCVVRNITALALGSTNFNLFLLSGSNQTYTGNGTSGVLVWGAQRETAAYETSLIPTLSTSVTRVADAASKTGISSLIGQTEGTIYLEADIQKYNESGFYISISNGASLGDAVYLYQPSSGNLQILIRKTGNADGSITVLSANWIAGLNKLAIAYTATTIEVFINGVSKGSTTFTALPTLSQFTIGSRPDIVGTLVGTGGYNQALLFKTRLSNSDLAAITTL
jgi:hypothetical protein